MNLSSLIKTLVDYIDLGKRIATTLPGMALAFAVLLLLQPAAQWQQELAKMIGAGQGIQAQLSDTVQTLVLFGLIGFCGVVLFVGGLGCSLIAGLRRRCRTRSRIRRRSCWRQRFRRW